METRFKNDESIFVSQDQCAVLYNIHQLGSWDMAEELQATYRLDDALFMRLCQTHKQSVRILCETKLQTEKTSIKKPIDLFLNHNTDKQIIEKVKEAQLVQCKSGHFIRWYLGNSDESCKNEIARAHQSILKTLKNDKISKNDDRPNRRISRRRNKGNILNDKLINTDDIRIKLSTEKKAGKQTMLKDTGNILRKLPEEIDMERQLIKRQEDFLRQPPLFECTSGTERIAFILVCDTLTHCTDGSDEELCYFKPCDENQLQCSLSDKVRS